MNNFIEKIKKHIPVPKMMSFGHSGIDIGIDHIRHISFGKKHDDFFVAKYGSEKLAQSIDKHKSLADNQEVVEVLKKIHKNFKYEYVEVSLPEELAYVYTQEVDNGDPMAVRGQIEFKMEENVPLKAEESIFDSVNVLDLKNDKKLVSVSVVSRRVIEDYAEAFKRANMTIVSFLIQNQALSKSLIHKGVTDSHCIVAIEKKYIVVSIVTDGIVLYTSTINKTLFDDDLNLARVEMLDEVIKDIYRIMIFWSSYIDQNKQYNFSPIESIIVSSTHSNIIESEFINMMTNKLGAKIDKPNVWTNAFNLNSQIPPINKIDSYQYATAIGLALPKIK